MLKEEANYETKGGNSRCQGLSTLKGFVSRVTVEALCDLDEDLLSNPKYNIPKPRI